MGIPKLLLTTLPHCLAADKKRAESKEQQLKALLARIDELQAEKQQLQSEKQHLQAQNKQLQGQAATAQSLAANLSNKVSGSESLLAVARKQYQQEVDLLKQQLASAQQQLNRTQSSTLNNAAEVESLKQQMDASKAVMDDAKKELRELTSNLEKAETEKKLLLTHLQSLLELNKQLQLALTEARQKQVGSTATCCLSLLLYACLT
jgi:chromosome segregation ATPase